MSSKKNGSSKRVTFRCFNIIKLFNKMQLIKMIPMKSQILLGQFYLFTITVRYHFV